MASNVVSVFVRADSSALKRAFDDGATAGERFKARLELLGKAAVAALAIKALGAVKDFVGDSVRAFSDLQESTNAVRQTFGDAAEDVLAIGENSAQSFGLARSEFNTAAVSFAGFADNIAGDSGDVAEVIKTLVGRATDFASIMNLEVNEAMGIFQSTLAGQSRPIRQYGLDISDTAIKLHALETGLIDTDREMSEGEKQMARYSLLLQETEKWAGDFARTSGDLANKERIVNAELENSKALLGEIISPLKLATLEMQGGFIQSINDASIALGGMTGALEDGDAALLSFKNETGESAKTIQDVITGVEISWQSWTREIDVWADALFGGTRRLDDTVEGVKGLIEQSNMGTEGIAELRREVENMGRAGKLTTEEVDALTAAIDEQEQVMLSDIYSEHEKQLYKNRDAQREAGEATAEATELTEEQIAVIEEYKKVLDELVGVSDRSWGEITNDVEAFLDGFKEVPEEADITMAEFEENFRARAEAMRTFWVTIHGLMGIEGTSALVNELIAQGPSAVGVAQEYLADPIKAQQQSAFIEGAELGISGLIGAVTGAKIPAIHVPVSVSSFTMRQLPTGEVVPSRTGQRHFQRGGIVTEGFLDGNRSSRQEAIVPLDTAEGKRLLAEALSTAMNGGNGSGVHFHGPVYGLDDFERKLQEVLVRARRKGLDI